MNLYIGTKIIKAEPCKAWKDAGGHKIGDDGYKVIYPDGYVSWSPKEVFEVAYRQIDKPTMDLITTAFSLSADELPRNSHYVKEEG